MFKHRLAMLAVLGGLLIVTSSAGADMSDFGELGLEQRASLMLHGDFSSFQSNLGETGG